jgi:endonuclease/exonuclease/phosphatase family metal-dependent hydrolase
MKFLLKFIAGFVCAILLIVIGFMIYSTFAKYKPKKIEVLEIHQPILKSNRVVKDEFNILTWNIGYAGLGKEMDFFYEGGKMVRPSVELCQRYFNNILNEIKGADSSDFIFIQEADQYSKRTYYKDEVKGIQDKLGDYYSVFAVNYDVPFVPIPIMAPMGRVKAGQMTLSRLAPDSAWRYATEGSYSWPKRLFLLDRCFVVTLFTFPSGKKLILINVHNSAFSDAVEARQKELNLLKNLMVEFYRKGDYVVVGGDWNQNPPGFDPKLFQDGNKGYAFEHVPEAFCPMGWNWVMDKSKATNRNVNEPFVKGKILATMIDFFIASPNVSVVSVKTNPNGFVNSDHQPVALKVRLN